MMMMMMSAKDSCFQPLPTTETITWRMGRCITRLPRPRRAKGSGARSALLRMVLQPIVRGCGSSSPSRLPSQSGARSRAGLRRCLGRWCVSVIVRDGGRRVGVRRSTKSMMKVPVSTGNLGIQDKQLKAASTGHRMYINEPDNAQYYFPCFTCGRTLPFSSTPVNPATHLSVLRPSQPPQSNITQHPPLPFHTNPFPFHRLPIPDHKAQTSLRKRLGADSHTLPQQLGHRRHDL